MENLSTIAILSIASGIISILSLLALHFTDPEFQPSWRMVSEYALGKHKWLLSLFFFTWSISTILTAILLFYVVSTGWTVLGITLILISGIGALMGGLFDVKHKLHGLAFFFGVPFLPIGALLINYHLIHKAGWEIYKNVLLFSAHACWISLVLMVLSMMLLFSGFKKAGVPFGKDIEPPKTVPTGVIAINGYVNRLLVFFYIFWAIAISAIYLAI